MTKEIKLPEISENAESGIVSEIMVSEGDHIDESQSLIAVESDKATVEVPSEVAGTVKDIKVKEDDEIKTGDVILILDVDDNGKNGNEEQKKSKKIKSGQEEKEEKATSKETKDKNEQEDDAKKTDTKKVAERDPEEKKPPEKSAGDDVKASSTDKSLPAAPLARRLARELDIDLKEIKENGPDENRITSGEVMEYVKHLLEKKGRDSTVASAENEPSLPDFSKWGKTESEPLSSIRKATSNTTSKSWRQIPHVTQFEEADITNLEKFRNLKKEENGQKISMTAILIKILGEGLRKFPKFNASLDLTKGELIYKKYYNISVAVDTPKGLLMPVIRKIEQKDLQKISEELKELVAKAIDSKLDQEAMQGGNIAISNQGTIGGAHFTPIIFPPQVAILGVGSKRFMPHYDEENKQFVPREMLPLALSYDHRVIDGADAARFIDWFCKSLENPLNIFTK